MKIIQCLAIACVFAGTVAVFGQTPAKGDAAKGKEFFNQQCELCHDPASTDRKMGPGLKGLFKRPTLSTTGKPANEVNVREKINVGGNGMPPYKDMGVSDIEVANLIAYLKTL